MIFYKFIIYNKNIRFDKKVKFEEFDSFIKMLKTKYKNYNFICTCCYN